MSDPAPLLPPLALAVAMACVAGAGALAACSLLAALIKTPSNGLVTLIMQLVAADFILLATTIGPELWSFNENTWNFGKECCVAYRGLNVFASTASSYLILTVALHTLATVNLDSKTHTRRSKRNNQDDDDEIRSSRHSLVASSDSSTPPRTMNLDYRLADTTVPVTQPTIFIWVLSVSLSVPEFTLATIVNLDKGVVLCTVIDTTHRIYMYSMLVLFNFFLPTVMMVVAGVLVTTKLSSKKREQFAIKDAAPALRLSLWLIVTYVVMCAPRSLAKVYHFYASFDNNNKTYTAKNETIITLSFSCAYLLATLVRPLLCITLLPRVRNIFSFNSRLNSEDV